MTHAQQTIATEILRQLGGQRFIVMTGARTFIDGGSYLAFAYPKAKDGSNKMRITLTAADDYTVETFFIRGVEVTAKTTEHGIYEDMLQAEFTRITGFDTHL